MKPVNSANEDPFDTPDGVYPVGNLGLRNIESHIDEDGVRVITDAELVYVSIHATPATGEAS